MTNPSEHITCHEHACSWGTRRPSPGTELAASALQTNTSLIFLPCLVDQQLEYLQIHAHFVHGRIKGVVPRSQRTFCWKHGKQGDRRCCESLRSPRAQGSTSAVWSQTSGETLAVGYLRTSSYILYRGVVYIKYTN